MPSCNTYCLTWVLLPWAWGISSQLLQQSTAIAPYLDKGYLLTAALPDLQCGIAPLGPPAPAQPRLWVTPLVTTPGLGHGLLLHSIQIIEVRDEEDKMKSHEKIFQDTY